jgi:hypothetical protein
MSPQGSCPLTTQAIYSLASMQPQACDLHRCERELVPVVHQIRIEKLCSGCDKRHESTLWYYRHCMTADCEQWLCAAQYVLLEPAERLSWQMFPLSR